MTYYTKQDLEMLENWIQKKLVSMDTTNNTTPSYEYSEVNLSRAILKFVQHLVQQERNKISYYTPYTPDPYVPGYNLGVTSPSYSTYTVSDNTKTICDQCQAKNPSATHCVHKVTAPLKF